MLTSLWLQNIGNEAINALAINHSGVCWIVESEMGFCDPRMGHEIKDRKRCKTKLTCIAASPSGQKIATGDDAGVVTLRRQSGEGILKFNMNHCITDLRFNHMSDELAVAAGSEIGFWSKYNKSVGKHKLPCRVSFLFWHPNNISLVACLVDGRTWCLDRSGNSIWSVSEADSEASTTCAVKSTDGKIAVGRWHIRIPVSGSIRIVDLERPSDLPNIVACNEILPTAIQFVSQSLIVMGTPSGAGYLVSTRCGVLKKLHQSTGWISAIGISGNLDQLFIATGTGAIEGHQFSVPPLNALHKKTYAARIPESPTLIQITSLGPSAVSRILDIEQLVLNLAIFEDNIVVISSESARIFSITQGILLHCFSLQCASDISLLALTGQHIITSHTRSVCFHNFHGDVTFSWSFESTLRFMRVQDGLTGAEVALIGLNDGRVYLVCHGHRPNLILKHKAGIQSVDMDLEKRFVAIVDDISSLTVYKTEDFSIAFSAHKIASAAFNQIHPSILALTTTDGRIRYRDLLNGSDEDSSHTGVVLGFFSEELLVISASGDGDEKAIRVMADVVNETGTSGKESVARKNIATSLERGTHSRETRLLKGADDFSQYIALLQREYRLVKG